MKTAALFLFALTTVVLTTVLAEPFSKLHHLHHHHSTSASASGSGSGSASGSGSGSGSASGSGYHYAKPKKPFYLPAASHTKIKIIKHHGHKKIKKVKHHHKPTYSAPSSSSSGSGSGSSSSGSGSGSGTSSSGHAGHYKPHLKVIIKNHGKYHG